MSEKEKNAEAAGARGLRFWSILNYYLLEDPPPKKKKQLYITHIRKNIYLLKDPTITRILVPMLPL